MSKIHLEIFDKDRHRVFKLLAYWKGVGYLAGGTALSLQLNHRRSFDFDVFLDKPITNALRLEIKKIFSPTKFLLDNEDQLSFIDNHDVNITFLWYYFQPLESLVPTDSIFLASIADIAADKARTIGRRAVWRDYVDLFFLLKEKELTLETVVKLAQRKFDAEFNETLFLQELSYFKDVEIAPIEFVDKTYQASEIQSFLEKQVKDFTMKLLE